MLSRVLLFQCAIPRHTPLLYVQGLCEPCSSVDMFLAIVVAALVWHWAAWAYDGRAWRPRHKTEPPDQRQWGLTALILGVLAILAYIIIAGGA